MSRKRITVTRHRNPAYRRDEYHALVEVIFGLCVECYINDDIAEGHPNLIAPTMVAFEEKCEFVGNRLIHYNELKPRVESLLNAYRYMPWYKRIAFLFGWQPDKVTL